MRTVFRFCAVGVAASVAMMVSSARGQSEPMPTQQEMFKEMQALRSEVTQLRAQVERQQTNQAAAGTQPAERFSEEDATKKKVEADAEARGDLGMNAGYNPDKGFIIRSSDDQFLLHPWAFFQFRDSTNYRAHSDSGTDTQNGFETPRLKLILDGNVFSKDLTYQFIWATDDTTGDLGLQDAWARYHFPGTPFAIEAGQIRNPLDHEQIVFATRSLTPDRSIVNSVLLNGDDIVKGAELSYGYDTNADVGAKVAVTSGERNFDTSFESYPTNDADWGVVGRVEWKVMGDWENYDQFTSLSDKAPLLVFGAGADYTETGSSDALTHVIDAQYNIPNGLGLYGAYLGRFVKNDANGPGTNGAPDAGSTTAERDTYDSTVRLMGSYLIDRHFEPFVRYEYIQFDPHEFATASSSTIHDVTLGFNYYLYGHRAKFTFGATYLPVGSPVANSLDDLLVTQRGAELILQGQFQLIL